MANEVRSIEAVIEFDGAVVAGATGFSLDINGESIDIGTLDSGGWKKVIGGECSWGGSFDGLVQRGSTSDWFRLMEHMITNNNAVVTVALKLDQEGDKYLTGSALLSGLSLSGAKGEVMTYSASYEGDGIPTIETVAVV